MIQVFVHNSNIQRGQCGACQSRSATWTITGTAFLLGSVKTDICGECIKTFDIPAWSVAAEKRIVGELQQYIREESK